MRLKFTFMTVILPCEVCFKNDYTGEIAKGDIILLAYMGHALYVVCAYNKIIFHENPLLVMGAQTKTLTTKLPLIGYDWNLISTVASELNQTEGEDQMSDAFKIMPIDRLNLKDRLVVRETHRFLAA